MSSSDTRVYRIQGRARRTWEVFNGPIPDGMVIHHKNGDPSDDRLENLELLTPEEHVRHHHLLPEGQWARAYDACVNCGETTRKHAAKGLCTLCYGIAWKWGNLV